MSAVASQIPASRLFAQPFIQAQPNEKYQSSASLAFVRGIHGNKWIPLKGPVTRKWFYLMTSAWKSLFLSEVVIYSITFEICYYELDTLWPKANDRRFEDKCIQLNKTVNHLIQISHVSTGDQLVKLLALYLEVMVRIYRAIYVANRPPRVLWWLENSHRHQTRWQMSGVHLPTWINLKPSMAK